MRIILAMLLLVGAAAAAPVYYVSPVGRDAWSGRLAAPNRARTDGPFATPARALRAARGRDGTRITLAGGVYALDAPLRVGPEHTGLTIEAAHGAAPVLSGGVRLTGGRVDSAGRWVFPVPEDLRGGIQLFVNGHRRYRARLPKTGFFRIEQALAPSTGDRPDRFVYRSGDIRADWANLGDVEVCAFHQWTMARLRIDAVDAAARTVRFTGGTWHAQMGALGEGDRYLVENVREALSEPGEWVMDRAAGTLTYVPMPGERLDRAQVVLPRLERLVELRGVPGRPVSGVTFRGITFAHTAYATPPQGHSYPQAEMDLTAAITAEHADGFRLEACRIVHTGGYAVDWGAGCRRCTVQGCRLTDLGGGGVRIGTMDLRKGPGEAATDNAVTDTLIAHGGRLHPAAVGVWIGHSAGNRVEHNEIADLYYTGVSVGWSWGYGESGAHHNTVAGNHIHRIGQALLSDMGGIYTLGLSPGSVLRGNLIHDVDSDSYGGWGIYFDEGTTGMLAEDNVVYRCKSAGFHQHYGRDNVVRRNIFALNRENQLMRTRAEAHLSFTFEDNVVYYTQGNLLGSNWEGDGFRMDHNLYWNASGQPVTFAGQTFEQWKARGQDVHSRIADPLFVDAERGNFRLKPGSPVAAFGTAPVGWEASRHRAWEDAPEPPAWPAKQGAGGWSQDNGKRQAAVIRSTTSNGGLSRPCCLLALAEG